eukprot:g10774.t2
MESHDMAVSALLSNLGRLIVAVARNGTSANAAAAQQAQAKIANFERQWKHGVDMVVDHEAKHFKASRAPRPRARMMAKLREDLDNFSVSASNAARWASQQYPVPPPSHGNFPPIYPLWTTLQAWIASGGLGNTVDYTSATKNAGGGRGSQRSKPGECKYSEEDCPHNPCRFGHGPRQAKRKSDGAAASGAAKRQATNGGRRNANTAAGPPPAPSAAASRPKRKGKASTQQAGVEDEEAPGE